jgi:hypothetical protein
MRLHFENTIKANPINGIKKYKDYFLGKAIHLASPPLIADDDFITATTVYFKDKLHYGIAPDSLRKKLCDLHADVFRSACEEIGLRYVSPPGEALDASGFLLREYWADSTHATRAYGRLLHRQIMEALSPRASNENPISGVPITSFGSPRRGAPLDPSSTLSPACLFRFVLKNGS